MRVNANSVMNHLRSVQHLHQLNQSKSARSHIIQGAQMPHKDQSNVGAISASKTAKPKPLLPGVGSVGHSDGSVGVIECGPPAASAPSQSVNETLTLEGLYAAWGQTKSPYDLTGNGMVDVDDLLQFINSLQTPASNSGEQVPQSIEPVDVAAPPIIPAVDLPANAVQATPDPLTLDGLLDAWGQPNSPYDLNNDGTVNVDDLLSFVNGMGGSGPQPATLGPPDIADKALVDGFGGAARLADSLIERLTAAGYSRTPPTNIRELIHKLGLPQSESKDVLAHVSRHYPRGLGVNAVG